MKTLVLVRHAHALSSVLAQVALDASRPLSDEGRQQAAQSAKRLAALDIKPAVILTSPLLRAVQTAESLAQTLGGSLEKANELNGFLADEKVADFLLTRLTHNSPLVAVGHNPNITCVYHLLGGQVKPFSPADFAVLKFDDKNHLQQVTFGGHE